MQHVDALSRCSDTVLVIEENTLEENLAINQAEDKLIRQVKNGLEKEESKMFELREGLVYRKDGKRLLFYVPQAMECNIIRTSHDDMSHGGCEKTIEVIRRSYWFPQMRDKVKHYISNCLKYITYNANTGKRSGFLHSVPKGDLPFNTLHIDHCGPLEKTKINNKYIFAVIDGFAKYIKLYACKTTNTQEVLKHLPRYFSYYGKPIRIISDRGSAFTANGFKGFMTEQDIEHVLIDEWDVALENVEYAINNTINMSTKQTPAKLLFGINQRGNVNDGL